MNKQRRLKTQAMGRLVKKRSHTCRRCGAAQKHWITPEFGLVYTPPPAPWGAGGFYTCPDLYGEDGRRKPEHILPQYDHASRGLIIAEALLSKLHPTDRSGETVFTDHLPGFSAEDLQKTAVQMHVTTALDVVLRARSLV